MLTRRHIRARVMQALYACRQSEPQDTDTFRKNFLTGIERINDLYALQASLLDAIVRKAENRLEARRAKHFASPQERTPNRKFAENPFSALLTENPAYARACQKYASLWADHSEYVENLLGAIEATPQYERYMNSADTSFAGHKAFLVFVFREIIAPDDALSDFYEDCDMDWSADLPVANTMLLKTLEDVKENQPDFSIPALFKDASDRQFAIELLEKSLSEGPSYRELIVRKAENWDPERIALVDMILMEMAVTEFVSFPSIPTKVTLNEYIELAKDYSSPKSPVFVNGILDTVLDELNAEGKIHTSGRGLM